MNSALETNRTYTYAGTSYANPHAPTQIATGYSTTTYTYDNNGNIAQWFDHAPYGSVLASTNTGTTKAARQYIGQFSDDSGLSYLNARYYQSTRGQFLSQDPVFLAIENPNQIKQLAQEAQNQLLIDPQLLNGYSYGRNNPIILKDPAGNQAETIGTAAGVLLVWSWASLLYSGLQRQIRDYELETMKLYPEAFTAEEVRQAESANKNEDAFDAAGAAIGLVSSKAGAIVDVIGVAKDIYSQSSGGSSGGQLFDYLGGIFQYVTTPKTLGRTLNLQPGNGGTTATNSSPSSYFGGSSSSAFSYASASVSAASQAISRGDYSAAIGYLSNASAALGSVK